MQKDICIIGGGIIGVTIARALASRFPRLSIALVEKESFLGSHTSTRNSSVIHSGIYYATDSLKAKFSKRGNEMLSAYCVERSLPLVYTGKFVIASNSEEFERLQELKDQAERNKIQYEWLEYSEALRIEPSLRFCDKSFKFLFTPTTKVGDNIAVMRALEKDLRETSNIEILYNTKFQRLDNSRSSNQSTKFSHLIFTTTTTARQNQLRTIDTRYVVNTAGLYADKVAKEFGFCKDYAILPFKGNYIADTRIEVGQKVRSLIYPIPPRKGNYFLGVHLTKTVAGGIKIGPSAVPALYREQYGDQEFQIEHAKEAVEIMYQHALNFTSKKANFYLRHLYEESKKFYAPHVIQQATKLFTLYDDFPKNMLGMPIQDQNMFQTLKPGIRAQLVDLRTRELVNDFIIQRDDLSMHLLNVVSPGWTCSFPIAEYISDIIADSQIFQH